MNRTLKKILIGTGILVAILAIISGGFMIKMKSELKKMNVLGTKEVVHNIYSIKDSFVNMYLIKDSDCYVAIDAGNDRKVISDNLKILNINPDKVAAVLLTHTDGDHTGALRLFRNARIYLSKNEEQMINGKKTKLLFFHNRLSTKEYILLDDEQTILPGGVSIKAIMTPGHTLGSMSYLVNDTCLFVGDAFGLKNGKVDTPNKFFSSDMKTAILSFDKISNLSDVEYIFTAHNGYTNNYKNAVNTRLN